MRKSFSMIELIFVIVIIGIIASIAIPKLMATRDDAQASVLATQVKDGVKELMSFYTSQGEEINFSKIPDYRGSQIILNELINHGWLKVISDNYMELYAPKGDENITCIGFYTDGYQIKLEVNKSNNSPLCSTIKNIIKDKNYTVLTNNVNFQ